jgi:Tfp pilus assembly protein PilF
MATPAAAANVAALLELARECRQRGDSAGQAAALDRLLAADPRNIPALMQRADLYAAAGDPRSASAFYLTAIRSAPASGVTKAIAGGVARGNGAGDRWARDYQE